eukprot:129277-Pleurochrysis_carterae.AAC.2
MPSSRTDSLVHGRAPLSKAYSFPPKVPTAVDTLSPTLSRVAVAACVAIDPRRCDAASAAAHDLVTVSDVTV